MGEKSTVKCSKCGFDNPSGFKFCGNCAAPLVKLDTEKTKSAIDAAPAPLKKKMKASSAQIKGERRRVAVMFADITGFSEMSRQRDPEDLKRLVDGAFARLTEVVYQYEGYIDKIIGDSLMVLYGAPIAHEDDSERAVLCAFKLLDTITDYSREMEVELTLSIGIARGLCYAGEYGRPGDYTVIGKDVNLAERLEKIAPPGSIYTSQEVYNQTHKRIGFKEIGEIDLKGVGEQSVYEALLPSITQIEGIPFVGRQAELARLKQAYEQAREGEGVLYFITGERGIGKSRLYQRFKKEYIDTDDVFFGQARGVNYLRNEFYHVLREVLRGVIGASEELAADSVSKVFNDFIHGREHLKYASPCVKHLLSLPMDAEERTVVEGFSGQSARENIEGIISSFLLRLAEEKPLVIAIEDAQYADASSLGFFAEFVKLLGEKKIFVMALSWEMLDELSPQAEIIKLPALSHNDIVELVKLHFDAKPPSTRLIETIFNMTKGNPLFIEEIIEILKQDNLVDIGEKVELSSEKIEIPDRIYNIVLARIDKLDEMPKEVLKRAAVIGFEFTDLLLSQMGEGATVGPISDIEKKDFIRYICDASYDNEKARLYIFKNEIIKDVAYELILKQERMEFHRSLAEALERIHSANIDPYVDTIAHHYRVAGDPRAAAYILKSGIRKLEGYRLDEALADFNGYLELCKKTKAETDPKVYVHIGNLYCRKAEYEKAFKTFEKAEEVAPDDDTRGRIKNMRGKIYNIQGSYDKAENELLAAAALVSSARNKADVYGDLGSLYSGQGLYPKAMEYFNKGLDIARSELGEKDYSTAKIYNNMAMVLGQSGDLDAALEHFRISLDINLSLYGENHPNVASGYNNIAITNARKGDYSAVIEGFKKALDIQIAIFGEDHFQVSSYYNNLGMGYYYLRDYDTAVSYVKKSLKILVKHLGEEHPTVASYYNNIAQAYWHIGEFAESLKYQKKAVAIWRKIPKPQPGMGMSYGNLGELYLLLGRYKEAGEYMQSCYDVYTGVLGKDHVEAGRSILRIAEYSFRIGKYTEALEHYEHALKMFEEKFGEKHETTVYTYGWLGIVNSAVANGKAADDYFAKCLAGYEDIQGKNPDMGLLAFDFLLQEGRLEEAEVILARAARDIAKRRNRKGYADMLVCESRLEYARSNLPKALELASQALEIGRKLNLEPMIIDALTAAARASSDRKYVDEALEMARRIGDKSRVDRLLKFGR